MNIRFKTLQYQLDCVKAVADCFVGQQLNSGEKYTINQGNICQATQQSLTLAVDNNALDDGAGFKNAALFDLNKILQNIKHVQATHALPQSTELLINDKVKGKEANLTGSPLNLNIEMETGTGKTYCYIRSIFELNKRYGWSKFIVIVPSVAIREGVNKSFKMTADHFQQEFGCKAHFFIYDSKQLHNLESFSANSGINVMIINMQAFNARGAEARRIYDELDEFQSRRPIDVISRNNPILILDEPQKMSANKTLAAMQSFKPLFILRYSATHKRDYNLIYRLDALDAYNHKLVKRILVKGIDVKGLSGTHGYLYLQNIEVSTTAPVAWIELEVKRQNGFSRSIRKIKKADDLYAISNNAEQYKNGYVVTDIDARSNSVHFINGKVITANEAIGAVDETTLRTIQIRETIKSHFEKEKILFSQGIKVLSLFFIDEVAKYRQYDDAGMQQDGEYAQIFTEQYSHLLAEQLTQLNSNDPYYCYLKSIAVEGTHAGYFAIDKNQRLRNPAIKNVKDEELNISVKLADDVDAYDLILKDKESLLAFPSVHDNKAQQAKKNIRFIFSHSALREGWDNPNVFVICTLKHSDNIISRRQEVGRGLRLAVNKHGERIDANYLGAASEVHKINELTVVSNESYSAFVAGLQNEMASVLADRPIKITPFYFNKQIVIDNNGAQITIDEQLSLEIYDYLKSYNYIDGNNQVADINMQTSEQFEFKDLPNNLKAISVAMHQLLARTINPNFMSSMIADVHSTMLNSINKRNLESQEFNKLWNKINKQAIYQLDINTQKLVSDSIKAIEDRAKNNQYLVRPLTYRITTGEQKQQISRHEVAKQQSLEQVSVSIDSADNSICSNVAYDLIGNIAEITMLKRATVVQILKGIAANVFAQFKNNPEAFIAEVSNIIDEQKATQLLHTLTYHATGHEHNKQEIFTSNEKIPIDALAVNKHVWNHVHTDSDVESKFASELEKITSVLVYAKLPDKFKIPTPFGSYNPDWAIVIDGNMHKLVYFMVETKGDSSADSLRASELRKINSAKKFIAMLNESETDAAQKVKYSIATTFADLVC